MKHIGFVFLFLIITHFAFSQNEIDTRAFHAYKVIATSFCEKDTVKTILLLDQFQHNFPDDGLIFMTNKMLADLLIKKGEFMQATNALHYFLDYPEKLSLYFPDSEECFNLRDYLFSNSKADYFVSLSKAFLGLNKPDSSLYYLNLAAGKYAPYKDCGNGYLIYQSYVSLCFSDHYLFIGDTTQAIFHLLDYCMQPDGNMRLVSEKLKEILLRKYTQKQIAKEVNDAIKHVVIKESKFNKGYKNMVLTLFGHEVVKGYNRDPKNVQKELEGHPSIQYLMKDIAYPNSKRY